MIITKAPREIDIMRKAGQIVARTHKELKAHIRPGITTGQLDAIAERYIRSQGATPSFKGYNGFTGSLIRLSFGLHTTKEEVERCIDFLCTLDT